MPQPTDNALKYFSRTFNCILALFLAIEIFATKFASQVDATLIVLTAIACLIGLLRQLPLQNILFAAVFAACIGGAAHGISTHTGIPFGPIIFNQTFGAKFFESVPWPIPFLWIAAIFIARGMARLILRPWRKLRNYGFWLIGATAILAAAFDFALEPFATKSKHWWLWTPTKFSLTWFSAPLVNFLSWAFVSLLILAFATPSLIKKQPGSPRGADWQPLGFWLGAFLLFAIGAAQTKLWPAVFADAGITIVTTAFAIRGARW